MRHRTENIEYSAANPVNTSRRAQCVSTLVGDIVTDEEEEVIEFLQIYIRTYEHGCRIYIPKLPNLSKPCIRKKRKNISIRRIFADPIG